MSSECLSMGGAGPTPLFPDPAVTHASSSPPRTTHRAPLHVTGDGLTRRTSRRRSRRVNLPAPAPPLHPGIIHRRKIGPPPTSTPFPPHLPTPQPFDPAIRRRRIASTNRHRAATEGTAGRERAGTPSHQPPLFDRTTHIKAQNSQCRRMRPFVISGRTKCPSGDRARARPLARRSR